MGEIDYRIILKHTISCPSEQVEKSKIHIGEIGQARVPTSTLLISIHIGCIIVHDQ